MGYYDVGHHNPPLTRIIAGIPYYMVNSTNSFYDGWSDYSYNAADHCEYAIGINQVLNRTNNEIRTNVYVARIFLIPLIVLGLYIGVKFAMELYGTKTTPALMSGLIFLMLWIGSPLILGWGATLCTDVSATAMGVIAFYAFWHWFKTPTPCKTVLNGVLLGLLPYTKLTWIIAFPIYLGLYLYKRRFGDAPDIKKFIWIIVLAITTINVGYWFDGSFTLLKNYKFISGALTGHYVERGEEVVVGNRFADSILGYIPIPFPYEFIRGMDTQKLDFERGFTSYAAGLTSDHGWCWYYAYALLLKEPVIVLVLLLIVLMHLIICYDFRKWDDTFVLVPAMTFFVFVSLNTGFSEHSRYILPAMPFFYLFMSRLGQRFDYSFMKSGCYEYFHTYIKVQQICYRRDAGFLLLCLCVSAFCVHFVGRPISYFNFTASKDKSQYLLGSNIDWGQSAYEIKDWCDTHVEARPRYVNYTRSMPFGKMAVVDDGNFPEYERKPGWMIISVNDIRNEKYKWLLKEKPVEILGGGSVFIYYLEPE
jgi:hypothetical protein